jgi:hypothetical protein
VALNARANQYTPVRVSSLTPGLEPWSPLMWSEITLSMWPHMKPYRRRRRCDYRRRPGSPATSRRAVLPDTGRTHRGLRVAPVRKHNRLFLCLSSVQRLLNTTLQITTILRHPTGCVCVSCFVFSYLDKQRLFQICLLRYQIWSFCGDMIWWSLLGLPAASEYLKNTTFRGLTSSPSSGKIDIGFTWWRGWSQSPKRHIF